MAQLVEVALDARAEIAVYVALAKEGLDLEFGIVDEHLQEHGRVDGGHHSRR